MTKVKMVMVLILAVVVAGEVFAQKASGDTYTMVGVVWGKNIEESEWGCEGGPNLATLLPNGIKNNTTYKVTVTGTSDKPLKKLRAVMASPNGALTVGDWDEAWRIPTKSIAAKKPFTFTTMMVSAANATSIAKDWSNCGLALTNLEALSNKEQVGKVMATLTNVKIAIEEMPEGTYFMRADFWKNGDGEEWQANFNPALSLSNLLPKGVKNNTTYKITVTGTSDAAMTKFAACMIDGNGDSLTGWDMPEIKVAAKKPFTYTVSLTTSANAASMAKDLKRCWLRMINRVDGTPKGHSDGDLMVILTNVKAAIEEVK